jgi:hypothetical protein
LAGLDNVTRSDVLLSALIGSLAGSGDLPVELLLDILSGNAPSRRDKTPDGCGLNSFSADTLVATAEGDVPIAQIAVGDRVLAYDELTGTVGYYPVTAVWSHLDPVIAVLTIDDDVIETTPEHPFLTLDRGWVAAGQLRRGERVREADGETGVVAAVTAVQAPQRMYNLTVAEVHTYTVGDEQWVVHNARNKCGGDAPMFTRWGYRGQPAWQRAVR